MKLSIYQCIAKNSDLVQEKHATLKLDLSLTSCGMNGTYSESRIELL